MSPEDGLAIYTGELAHDVKVRRICDPRVLQERSWWAYASLISFTVALGALPLPHFIVTGVERALRIGSVALLVAGLGGMLYVGHLGVSLVYQQGAGTYQSSDDCAKFAR